MKQYWFFNEEPNVNILGLDPIIHAFWSPETKKRTGIGFTDISYELDQGKMRAGPRKKELEENASFWLQRLLNEPAFEQTMVQSIQNYAENINSICRKTLDEIKTKNLSETDQKKQITAIIALFTDICTFGLVGPIVEFVNRGISSKVEQLFKQRFSDPKERNNAMLLLTSTFEENIDLQGEESLANISQLIFEKKYLLNSPEIKKRISTYLQDWGWLNYSYCGPALTEEQAVEGIKCQLELGSPLKRIEKIKREISESRKKQQETLASCSFSQHEVYLIKTARDIIQTKYLRGKMMALADFTINQLLLHVAKKERLSMKQIGVLTVREMLHYFKTSKLPDVNELNKRLKYCILISSSEQEIVLTGKEAKQWVKENVIEEEKVNLKVSEVSAQVACPAPKGIVKGKVKIVNTPREMQQFKEGDILISIATTPDIVPAMKKAAAIVTELGGLTCHAAIVSRELNKPCLISAKNATKIFKNDEEVIVDTDNGVIRRVKK